MALISGFMVVRNVEMFRIPFLTIMGNLTWHADFRRRLFKNRLYIVSKSDGFDCGYAPKLILWAAR
jgi:hypothetical protein